MTVCLLLLHLASPAAPLERSNPVLGTLDIPRSLLTAFVSAAPSVDLPIAVSSGSSDPRSTIPPGPPWPTTYPTSMSQVPHPVILSPPIPKGAEGSCGKRLLWQKDYFDLSIFKERQTQEKL